MSPRQLGLGSVALAAIIAVGYLISAPPDQTSHLTQDNSHPETSPDLPSQTEQTPEPAPGPEESLSEEQLQMLDDPRVIEFARHLEFQQTVREFFAESAALSEEERKERADKIRRQLTAHEQDGTLSAAESLMVRLALIRSVEADPTHREEASRALIQQFEEESRARMEAWKQQPRPEFDNYKQREQAIVEEVMTMESIPGNLTRNEYLRQRLHQARVETMGNNSGTRQP